MALLLALPAGASAAPSLLDRLNVIPNPWLQPVLDDLAQGAPAGKTLKDLTCPPVGEVDELVQGVPGAQDLTGLLTTATCNLDLLDFEFHTEYRRPDGTMLVKDTRALVNVPTLLSPDDDAGFELIGTIRVLSLDLVTVQIDRLPNVQEPLPTSVEAILADPSRGSLPRSRIAYGYDARESGAPTTWQTDLRLTDVFGDPDPMRLGVDVISSGVVGPVSVLGELFDPGPTSRVRRNRVGGRIRFNPVPNRLSVDLALGERIEAHLRTSTDTTADVLARIQEADDEKRVEATVDKLPRQVDIAFQQTGENQRRADYDALTPIDRLDVLFTDRKGAPTFDEVETTAELNVRDLPTGITVQQTAAQSAKLTTRGGPIGSIDGAFATGGAPIKETEQGHYVRAIQDEGFTSIAFRLLELERAEFIGTSPVLLDAVLEAGPFRATVRSPELDLDAQIRDVPNNLRLQFDLDSPRIIYDGNGAGIDEISLSAESPTPFFSRARRIEASVDDIPSVMQLDLHQVGDSVEFVTDNPIGAIEILATSGPGERLPDGEQGVIMRDQEDRFLIFGRIFGLRQVRLVPEPLNFLVRAGAGQPFRAEATIQQPGDDLELSGLIQNLPRRVDVSLVQDQASGTSLVYDADAPISRIVLDAHNLELIDRADDVRAEVNSVPAHFEAHLPVSGPLIEASAVDPIGSIQLQLADGAFENLPAGRDGAIYIDTPEQFAVTAKISQLRGFEVTTDPAPDLFLDLPDAPFPFDYRIERQPFSDVEREYFRGTLDRPQRDTRIKLETDPKVLFDYSAGGAISSITFESNIGDLGLVDATLSNLPRELSVCFQSGPLCKRANSPDTNALVSVDIDDKNSAIGPIDIDAFICIEPNNDVDCANSPQQFARITDLRLREFAVDAVSDGLDSGAFIDTDNRDVTGDVTFRDGDLGVDVHLPTGFRAQDRTAGIFSSGGSIACPSGTAITLVLPDPAPDINLAGLLC